MALVVTGLFATAAWGNSAPVVTQVTAVPTGDSRLVRIHYDLADADGDLCRVWLEISDDGGTTWTVPANTVTGDVGPGVRPGTNRAIVWNAEVDIPGQSGNFKARVYADDGHGSPQPGMVLIPAGEFTMGNTFDPDEGWSGELPVHTVYVSAFYMDKYEVTNEQYAAGLNWARSQGNLITVTNGVVYKYSSGTSYPYCYTNSADSDSCIVWNGSTFSVESGRSNQPVVDVSWYGSAAYANWRSVRDGRQPCYNLSTWSCDFTRNGYRLPTEAEWEKAARGGTPGHRFPWSDTDTIQHSRANYYSDSDYSYDTSPTRGHHPTFNTGAYPYTSPVGYFAPNGYGLYDMAGNVWEWCNDWWDSGYYSGSPRDNPRGPQSGSWRVLRGGCWGLLAGCCRSAGRRDLRPDSSWSLVGFRCASGT